MENNAPTPYGCFQQLSGPLSKKAVMKVIYARRRAERNEGKAASKGVAKAVAVLKDKAE